MDVIIATYFIVGFILSVIVGLSGGAKKDRSLALLFAFDPLWLLLWPICLIVTIVERSDAPESASGPAAVETEWIGAQGTVVAAFRPVGKIQIGSHFFDARTNGEMLPVGTVVRVLGRTMSELIVAEEPSRARLSVPVASRAEPESRRG